MDKPLDKVWITSVKQGCFYTQVTYPQTVYSLQAAYTA